MRHKLWKVLSIFIGYTCGYLLTSLLCFHFSRLFLTNNGSFWPITSEKSESTPKRAPLKLLTIAEQRSLKLSDRYARDPMLHHPHSSARERALLQSQEVLHISIIVSADKFEAYVAGIEPWLSLHLCPVKPVYFIFGATEDIPETRRSEEGRDVVFLEEDEDGLYVEAVFTYWSQIRPVTKWLAVFYENVYFNCHSIYQSMKYYKDYTASTLISRKQLFGYILSSETVTSCKWMDCLKLSKIKHLLPLSIINMNENRSNSDIDLAHIVHPLSLKQIIGINKNITNLWKNKMNGLMDNVLKCSNFSKDVQEFRDWPIGISNCPKPKNRQDVVPWEFFNSSHSMTTNLGTEGGLELIEQFLMETGKILEHCGLQFSSNFAFSHGYRRFDPFRGLDYRLFYQTKPQEMSSSKPIHMCSGSKPLLIPTVVRSSLPQKRSNAKITLILPCKLTLYPTAVNECRRFIRSFSSNSKFHVQINLVVVIFNSNDVTVETESLIDLISWTQTRIDYEVYGDTSVDWVSQVLHRIYHRFSMHSVLVVASTNQILTQSFINKVLNNTYQGIQIFMPIPFQIYRSSSNDISDKAPPRVHPKIGRFNSEDINIIAFYFSDWLNLHDQKWRPPISRRDWIIPENQTVQEKFFRHSSIKIFRSVESSCLLRWGQNLCLKDVDNSTCIQFIGSQKHLAVKVKKLWSTIFATSITDKIIQ